MPLSSRLRPLHAWGALAFLSAPGVCAEEPAPRIVFQKHVVVAQDAESAAVGLEILRAGGNAVDAAVATAFALAVTHPAAGNLGGGGFLVTFDVATGRVLTFDFREAAPGASTPMMYLGTDGKPLPHHREGLRAGGVPGTVRGLELAHSRLGRLPWKALVGPAEALAREGFVLSEPLARSLNEQLQLRPPSQGPESPGREDHGPDRMADFPASLLAYGKPDASPWRAGDRLVQPELAATLRRIAEGGADDFYCGETARRIVAAMPAGRGLITLEDLASYRAYERAPVRSTYRGHEVYGMGPVASGGIVVAQMLNLLAPFDLRADGRASPLTLHRVTEAMRRAFFTRATVIADPAFAAIPVEALVAPAHARAAFPPITDRATASAALASFPVTRAESDQTTHLSTLDSAGNAVALTYTLEESYGSKAVVPGTGFLLNNEMGDFNIIPGRTDDGGRIGTAPNTIAPGKRMLSSQAPTIVLKGGKVRIVTGSPGGRTIPNTVLWVLLNVLEFGMGPEAAVAAPRTHHAWFPDVLALEGEGWPAATLEALRGLGHRVRAGGLQGDAHTIVVSETGVIYGVADRRRRTETAAGD